MNVSIHEKLRCEPFAKFLNQFSNNDVFSPELNENLIRYHELKEFENIPAHTGFMFFPYKYL